MRRVFKDGVYPSAALIRGFIEGDTVNTFCCFYIGTSLNNSCSVNVTCDCENGNTKQITPDLKEAIFAKEFEDKIINAVFVKNDDKNTKDDTIVPTSTSPNVVRNVTSTISQGCNNRSKVMIFNKQDVGEAFFLGVKTNYYQ